MVRSSRPRAIVHKFPAHKNYAVTRVERWNLNPGPSDYKFNTLPLDHQSKTKKTNLENNFKQKYEIRENCENPKNMSAREYLRKHIERLMSYVSASIMIISIRSA